MSDLFPQLDNDPAPGPGPERSSRWVLFFAYSLVLVLITAMVTLGLTERGGHSNNDVSSSETEEPPAKRPSEVPLSFGDQDTVVTSAKVPAGTGTSVLLHYEVDVEPTPTSAPRAAMVSFRVTCESDGETLEMQSDGKTSTNVFVAQGGNISGQALTVENDQEMKCSLLASAPYIEVEDDGLDSLPLTASITPSSTDGVHVPALRWLDDATLFEPGTSKNVLSRRIDDPSTLSRMSSTVRLTSCTVVGGSRDGDGTNKCQESMTGRESSTVRIRVIARWLDAEGNIKSTSNYWDETLAIDYNSHHVPWTLRQEGMGDQIPEDASAVVLVVQVESVEGTPFVVHADGTDGVISTQP